MFQNPFESLNPRHQVRSSIARPLRVLRRLSRRDADAEVGELLERVRLPKRVAERFPVELSGGERQRVAIARALAAEPDLLICDEVTSALDVSVQAAVLELLQELQRELGLSMLFITHNLGVVACVADSVLVMDQGIAGRVRARRAGARAARSHEYTRRLLSAAPTLADVAAAMSARRRTAIVGGAVVSPEATVAADVLIEDGLIAEVGRDRARRSPRSSTRRDASCCRERSTCTRTSSAACATTRARRCSAARRARSPSSTRSRASARSRRPAARSPTSCPTRSSTSPSTR